MPELPKIKKTSTHFEKSRRATLFKKHDLPAYEVEDSWLLGLAQKFEVFVKLFLTFRPFIVLFMTCSSNPNHDSLI